MFYCFGFNRKRYGQDFVALNVTYNMKEFHLPQRCILEIIKMILRVDLFTFSKNLTKAILLFNVSKYLYNMYLYDNM